MPEWTTDEGRRHTTYSIGPSYEATTTGRITANPNDPGRLVNRATMQVPSSDNLGRELSRVGITRDQAYNRDSHPEAFERVMRQLGIPPEMAANIDNITVRNTGHSSTNLTIEIGNYRGQPFTVADINQLHASTERLNDAHSNDRLHTLGDRPAAAAAPEPVRPAAVEAPVPQPAPTTGREPSTSATSPSPESRPTTHPERQVSRQVALERAEAHINGLPPEMREGARSALHHAIGGSVDPQTQMISPSRMEQRLIELQQIRSNNPVVQNSIQYLAGEYGSDIARNYQFMTGPDGSTRPSSIRQSLVALEERRGLPPELVQSIANSPNVRANLDFQPGNGGSSRPATAAEIAAHPASAGGRPGPHMAGLGRVVGAGALLYAGYEFINGNTANAAVIAAGALPVPGAVTATTAVVGGNVADAAREEATGWAMTLGGAAVGGALAGPAGAAVGGIVGGGAAMVQGVLASVPTDRTTPPAMLTPQGQLAFATMLDRLPRQPGPGTSPELTALIERNNAMMASGTQAASNELVAAYGALLADPAKIAAVTAEVNTAHAQAQAESVLAARGVSGDGRNRRGGERVAPGSTPEVVASAEACRR